MTTAGNPYPRSFHAGSKKTATSVVATLTVAVTATVTSCTFICLTAYRVEIDHTAASPITYASCVSGARMV
jgi:hypothetical protein